MFAAIGNPGDSWHFVRLIGSYEARGLGEKPIGTGMAGDLLLALYADMDLVGGINERLWWHDALDQLDGLGGKKEAEKWS